VTGLGFSYAFEPGKGSDDLLSEARDAVRSLGTSLGVEEGDGSPGSEGGYESVSQEDQARGAALRLLDQLRDNVAELAAAAPELLPLAAAQFAACGARPSPAIEGLARDHNFYWLRIPYTLQPRADFRFDRLEIAIELNPGDAALARPRILAALPSNEFATLASATSELKIGIDDGLQFSVEAGDTAPNGGPNGGPTGGPALPGNTAGGHVAAQATGKLGFVAGPFTYRVRKAVVERGTLPSERVFWRISETEKLSEAPPELIAVIAVPVATRQLTIAAALQAYASAAVLTMTLGGFLAYLGRKLAQFFTSGAPVLSTRVWDMTPRLTQL
jgi:hypothetical protein